MKQVCDSDLKKNIVDFPLHVVQKMCEEQVKQGNKFDPDVFAMDLFACKFNGGFDWGDTEQGIDYWKTVISDENFTAINNKKYVHADLLMSYAIAAQTSETPWENFELRQLENDDWHPATGALRFCSTLQYRLKPKTIKIGGIDVPAPEKQPPMQSQQFWIASLNPNSCKSDLWMNDFKPHTDLLKFGCVHLSEENAKIHSNALSKLNIQSL